jgi:protein-disulfide isomerase
MDIKQKTESISEFITEYGGGLSLLVALIAVAISGYNTYQIKNLAVSPASIQGSSIPSDLSKALKELPEGAPFIGNPNAKLTVVEFADYQCPFCGRFFSETFPDLKREYIDTNKVKFIYLDFAFLGQESKYASYAALCAKEQGKFWEYHDELYNNQNGENKGAFNKNNLEKFAANVNLNLTEYKLCMESNKYQKLVADTQALGRKYGITGTPGFLIGKQSIKGAAPIDNFRQVIDSQL